MQALDIPSTCHPINFLSKSLVSLHLSKYGAEAAFQVKGRAVITISSDTEMYQSASS
jgi:hypothetical protein